MTREEKCKLAIQKGFIYDEETGNITTPTGLIAKKKSNNGYIMLTVRDNFLNAYYLYGHQFAWYYKYKKTTRLLDHKNRIKTDNRICNIRESTKSKNAMNMNNVKGYTYCQRSQKFIAIITVNYKKIHLGSFDNKEDAKNCYLENKPKYHNLNN
jgi:hypothetical protein